MKNSVRRGLFHPDDIKILGLSGPPGPMSAPLPNLSRKVSRPSLSPLTPSGGPSFGPGSARAPHSRSSSFVGGPASASGSGSFGRSEAKRINSQSEFDKYAEEDDEDYEDVFGKPNGTSEPTDTCHLTYHKFYILQRLSNQCRHCNSTQDCPTNLG